MVYTFNTKDFGWLPDYWRVCELEIEDNEVDEGYTLKNINDVISYLTNVSFADDYVQCDYVKEAVYNCATELGCIYGDVYDLENDIRRYYI